MMLHAAPSYYGLTTFLSSVWLIFSLSYPNPVRPKRLPGTSYIWLMFLEAYKFMPLS